MAKLETYKTRARIGAFAPASGQGYRANAVANAARAGTLNRAAQSFESFSQSMFRIGAPIREREGEEAALAEPIQRAAVEYHITQTIPEEDTDGTLGGQTSFRTMRDDSGLVVPDIPPVQSMSIFDQAYRNRMIARVADDQEIASAGSIAQLAQDNQRDPEAFSQAADTYRAAVIDSLPDPVKGAVDASLRRRIQGTLNGIIDDKARFDTKMAFDSWKTQLEIDKDDLLTAWGAQGGPLTTVKTGGQVKLRPNPELTGMLTAHGNRLARGVELGYWSAPAAVQYGSNLQKMLGLNTLMHRVEAVGNTASARGEQYRMIERFQDGKEKVLVPEIDIETGQISYTEKSLASMLTIEERQQFSKSLIQASKMSHAISDLQKAMNKEMAKQTADGIYLSILRNYAQQGIVPTQAELVEQLQAVAGNPEVQGQLLSRGLTLLNMAESKQRAEEARSSNMAYMNATSASLQHQWSTLPPNVRETVNQTLGKEMMSLAQPPEEGSSIGAVTNSVKAMSLAMQKANVFAKATQKTAKAQARLDAIMYDTSAGPIKTADQDNFDALVNAPRTQTPVEQQGPDWFVENVGLFVNDAEAGVRVQGSRQLNSLIEILGNPLKYDDQRYRGAAGTYLRSLRSHQNVIDSMDSQLADNRAREIFNAANYALDNNLPLWDEHYIRAMDNLKEGKDPIEAYKAITANTDVDSLAIEAKEHLEGLPQFVIDEVVEQASYNLIGESNLQGEGSGPFDAWGHIAGWGSGWRKRSALDKVMNQRGYSKSTYMVPEFPGFELEEDNVFFKPEEWAKFDPKLYYSTHGVDLAPSLVAEKVDNVIRDRLPQNVIKNYFGDNDPVVGGNVRLKFLNWMDERGEQHPQYVLMVKRLNTIGWEPIKADRTGRIYTMSFVDVVNELRDQPDQMLIDYKAAVNREKLMEDQYPERPGTARVLSDWLKAQQEAQQ